MTSFRLGGDHREEDLEIFYFSNCHKKLLEIFYIENCLSQADARSALV